MAYIGKGTSSPLPRFPRSSKRYGAALLGVLFLAWPAADGHCTKALAGEGWMFIARDRRPEVELRHPTAERSEPDKPSDSHRERGELPGHIFGYPTHQDPLFDEGTRLPYAHQHLERPRWNRPRYASGLPQYVKPSRAQEPIHKPTYRVPLAVAPLDNKPRYNIENYVPPSARKPSLEYPTYMDRPNYVIKPLEKPSLDRPAYDRSGVFYGRPAYAPPVYTPEEIKPPRYAPSPFIAPPQ